MVLLFYGKCNFSHLLLDRPPQICLSAMPILPYSAAQMFTPNHTITTKDDKFDSSQLRRIEIRVRRQNR